MVSDIIKILNFMKLPFKMFFNLLIEYNNLPSLWKLEEDIAVLDTDMYVFGINDKKISKQCNLVQQLEDRKYIEFGDSYVYRKRGLNTSFESKFWRFLKVKWRFKKRINQ